MLKLWGRFSSINVQKVAWTLDELGLAHEHVDAGGAFGIVDTPAYRALNPNGLVPVLEDSGFVLWESNAIVRYLATKHAGGSLWPSDLRGRADADRWMEWQSATANPVMRDAFAGLIRTPPDQRDAGAIARSAARFEAMAAILDTVLAETPYLAGEAFTVADIPAGLMIHRWLGLPLDRIERPNVLAWYGRLKARPGATRMLSLAVE
jgi:glutathione S-transferase